MCRSIKVLRRSGEIATPEELRAAALQFVRKISGSRHPSRVNETAFDHAVNEIAEASQRLLDSMGVKAARPTHTESPHNHQPSQ